MRLQQGKAEWIGRKEFPLISHDMVPFSSHLWLPSVDRIDFEQLCTSEITDVTVLFQGLDRLQTQILQTLARLDQQNAQAELVRFEEQAQIDQRVVAETLGELIAVLPYSSKRVSPPVPQTVESSDWLRHAAPILRLDAQSHADGDTILRIPEAIAPLGQFHRSGLVRSTAYPLQYHDETHTIRNASQKSIRLSESRPAEFDFCINVQQKSSIEQNSSSRLNMRADQDESTNVSSWSAPFLFQFLSRTQVMLRDLFLLGN